MLHFFWCGYNLTEDSYTKYEFANLEIAKWAEYYFSQKTSFHQSNWLSGRVTDNPQDILLGHPTWAGHVKLSRDWVKDNALSPNDKCHPNTYILMPWVPEFPPEWTSNIIFLESQLMAARKIFALGGEIWIERTFAKLDNSIQARVKDKLVHCNMGVAAQNFSKIKQNFNPIGERQLLHMSNLAHYKGFDITCKSVNGLDTLMHVASASLQTSVGLTEIKIDDQSYIFNFLGHVNNNDPDFQAWVVDNCDFYIHTGRMDAQATTILENCARGLIPLVTPESGFSSPHAIYLTHNPEENKKIIEWALNLPESELLKRSSLLREQMIKEHSWEGIFGQIWDRMIADINQQSNVESDLQKSVSRKESDRQNLSNTSKPMNLPSNLPKKVDQRLYISHSHLLEIEKQVQLERHIERYALLRQFAKGVVCDAACGCGYGSYLLATNPDVQFVIGLDAEADAISHARNEYLTPKTEFQVANLDKWVSNRPIDMLLSVETIEHIENTSILPNFVDRNAINHVILTYPSKKTTHYNPYHYHDFKLQEILDMFNKFTCYRHFNWEYEFDVVFLIRNPEVKS